MDISSESEALLRKAGYAVRRDGKRRLLFEDSAVLGFIMSFENEQAIIDNWKDVEAQFVTDYASILRGSEKAWSGYSIFLTSAVTTRGHAVKLIEIEEDFVSTRKIARSGVVDARNLTAAIAPLLAVQDLVNLDPIVLQENLLRSLASAMPENLASELLKNPRATVASLVASMTDEPR
jgi:hypothetical protein